jgi:predicted HAD superfamily Cof-like phosphohydrolase
MAKAGGPTRADGKKLKPEGWEPPRIKEMLKEVLDGFEADGAVGGE